MADWLPIMPGVTTDLIPFLFLLYSNDLLNVHYQDTTSTVIKGSNQIRGEITSNMVALEGDIGNLKSGVT